MVVFQYIQVGGLNPIMVTQAERVLERLLVFGEAVDALEKVSEPQLPSS